MITVAQLKEFLNSYNNDSEIRWMDGSQISHINAIDGMVVLSDQKYIGHCNNCGNEVYREKNLGEYDGYCLVCDENLYQHEILE